MSAESNDRSARDGELPLDQGHRVERQSTRFVSTDRPRIVIELVAAPPEIAEHLRREQAQAIKEILEWVHRSSQEDR